MKRTPMSIARAVGNRKLTFAMIERDRHVTSRVTTSGTYCQRQIMPMQHESDQALISEANQKAQGKHMVVPQPSRKKGTY